MVALKGDERIDYLLADQERRIIQSPTVFSFSIDAVLLANFTYLPIKKGKYLICVQVMQSSLYFYRKEARRPFMDWRFKSGFLIWLSGMWK